MKRKTRDNSWLHIEATLECLSFRSCRARTRDHERIFEFLFRIFSDLTTVDIETREKFRVISPYIFLFSTREDHRSRSKASSRYRRFGVSCPSSFEATQCVARAILACKRHPFVLLRSPVLFETASTPRLGANDRRCIEGCKRVLHSDISYRCLSVPFITVK